MRRAGGWAAGVVLGMGCGSVAARADPPASAPEVTFRFERGGLPVPRYTIRLERDGAALYEGEETSQGVAQAAGRPEAATVPLQRFRTEAQLSPEMTKKIFAMAGTLKQFHVSCATRAKNVADTGAKTLEYTGPDGTGVCSYNYSDNKTVMQLTEVFLGVAETMDQGRELDYLQRYDRLGLDAQIGVLANEVNTGRALELGTIAGTLRSLAQDTELMQRVRLKASQLLSLLPPEMQRATR